MLHKRKQGRRRASLDFNVARVDARYDHRLSGWKGPKDQGKINASEPCRASAWILHRCRAPIVLEDSLISSKYSNIASTLRKITQLFIRCIVCQRALQIWITRECVSILWRSYQGIAVPNNCSFVKDYTANHIKDEQVQRKIEESQTSVTENN